MEQYTAWQAALSTHWPAGYDTGQHHPPSLKTSAETFIPFCQDPQKSNDDAKVELHKKVAF